MKKYLNKREKSKKDFNYWCCNSGVHCRACGGVHCIVNSWLLSLKIPSSDVGDDSDDDDDGGGGEDDDSGDDGGDDGGGEDESDCDDDEEALDSILPLST